MLVLLSASCSSDFLEIPVQGGLTTSADPDLASKLVTGVYNSLMQGDCFGNGDVHGWSFLSVTCTMSDDADKGSFPSDQAIPIGDLDNFTISPTNKFVATLWSGHYNSIGSCNQALSALAESSLDTASRNSLIGEVRFIRGYLYFNLVRAFGGVPIVTRIPVDADDANTDPAFRTRASVTEVYNVIEEDLLYAIAHLPVTGVAPGHATKGAAQGMLAKVYMYLAKNDPTKWTKVLDLTQAVINSGRYTLVDDYATIWRQEGDNNSESMFEIQTGSFNNANFTIPNYTVCQGVRVGGLGGWNDLGYGFNGPTQNLYDAYEPGDLRRDATIIKIDNSEAHKGTVLWDGFRVPSSDSVQNLFYNYKAYTSSLRNSKGEPTPKEKFAVPADKDRPKNVRILRYADVLLMNSEAAVMSGTGDPTFGINLVRDRAGLDPVGGVTQELVWKERRVELAMEHDRFWDLVRHGDAAEVMIASGKTNFVKGKHELLPIPSIQIQLSGGSLTQNDGY